ncbi:autotransporter domain-containing protein [Marinicella litoralis]|uniref:Putative repeat protein (TIGR01451 family) n=1 Tax=Marinicella litoralis TaxID=644220 RepID=A0A4R6XXG9_9GAMM|nr:autotransporter domain-containing protein [Marinicella litoralis]TDR22373.1 putative repeat protein (TIGR01451 family) [Marinicella litoralis]
MRNVFQLKTYLSVLLVFMATSAWAQTDFQLTVSPSGNPIVFAAGGAPQMLTYTVTNNGPLDEGDQTTVTFFLDPEIEPASVVAPNNDWFCSQVTSQIDCDYTSIFFAGTSSDLVLTITSPVTPTTVFSALNVSVSNALGDSNPGNEQITSDIDFVAGNLVDLEIIKSISTGFPATVAPGDPLNFNLSITNLSAFAASNVVVMDDLLANNLNFNSTGSSPECVDVASFVQCNLSMMLPGENVQLTIATVVSGTAQPNNYINTATVSADEPDPDLANNSSDQAFTVAVGGFPEIDVAKSIIGNPAGVPYGDTLTYRIEVNNTGAGVASNVDLTDTLPAGVTFQGFNQLGNFICSYTAPTVSCNAASLPVTAAIDGVEITVVVDGNVGDVINNVASSTFADSNSLDNSSNVSFTVQTFDADLGSTKAVNGPATVNQGQPVEFTIGIVNNGPSNAYDVRLVDDIPTGLSFDTIVSENGMSCVFVAGNNQVVCDAPDLLNGNSHTAVVRMIANGAGLMTNTVTASSTHPAHFDPFTSDANQATAAVTAVGVSADLDLTLDSDSVVYSVGDTVTLDLTVHNPFASTGAPPNVTVVTTLPNQVVFGSTQLVQAIGWSCTHDGSPTGGDVTCDSQGTPVPIGTNIFIDILALADTAGTALSATATMTSDFDPNPSNDTINTAFDINPADADLSLVFTSVSGVYNQGDSIFYDIEVNNPMISTANPTDTTVDVTLPTEVSFVNANLAGAPGWFCTHDGSLTGGMVTCDRQGAAFVSFSTHVLTIGVLAVSPATNAIVQATISSTADPNLTNNTSNQADAINALTSDFSIVKTVSGTDFAINDTFTYFLEVTNGVASTASPSDVQIEDQLPPEISFDSFIVGTNLGTTINCVHDGSVTGGLFSCDTNGTLFAAGEVVTIDINVTAVTASPNVNNTATVTTSFDPDGNINNNASTAPTVTINPPLVTTIAANKYAEIAANTVTEVTYGGLFDYVLKVENTGINDAVNVHISDTLPPEVTLMGFDTFGWTCLPLNTNSVGEVVDCTRNDPLAAAGADQIIMNVMATTNPAFTSISNQMSAVGDNTGALVSASTVVNLLSAEGALLLTQNPSVIDPGDNVTFDVLFTNTGDSTLTGLTIDAALPQSFNYNGFVGDPGVSCAESAGTLNCTFTNPMVPNNSLNVSIQMTAPVNLVNNQNYDLVVTANALEFINPIAQSLGVNFSASDIAINLFSVVQQVNAGEPFEHVMDLRNSGNFDLNEITAVFLFPTHADLIGIENSDMNCSQNGNRITCTNLGPLPIGDSLNASFIMQSNGANPIVATEAEVLADGVRKSANTSTEILGMLSENEHDLSLMKSVSVTQVGQREAYSYTFDVVNVGLLTQTSFSLIDELPPGVIFQAAVGNGWSCVEANALTCQFTGQLNSGAATQLQVDVIAPNELGVVNNTARVVLDLDQNQANNQSSVDVEVITGSGTTSIADLAVRVTSDVQDVLNTESVSWTIAISNNGPDEATNVQLQNNFPMGFVAEEVLVGNGASCIMLNASLTCDLASLAVSQEVQIILNGSFSNGFQGMLINVFDVSSDAIDPDLSNNQGSTQINVISADDINADMALELVANNQDIRQGDMIEMKLRTSNHGPDSAVGNVLTASFTGLISQVQVINSGQWVCQANSGSLSCQFPANYPLGLVQDIDLLISTQQVVQTSQPITLSAMVESTSMDPQPGNNMVGFSNTVNRTPTEDEIYNLFDVAVGSAASDTVRRTIRNISSYCARSYFMAIEGLCEEMIASARPENGPAIINAMEEITPNEVVGQSTSASEMITSQFRNIDSRMSQLRGGGGAGLSVSGLNGRYGNESIPLGMLAYLNQSEEEQQDVSNISDFVSPWGFFVNGTLSMGEMDATGRELGFDFDTYGLTAGVDYRFSPSKVAGVALGYANFDSEIEGEAEMKSTGFTLTGYGSFYIKDNFYVDARISYGNPDFEQKRRINFELDNISIDRVATGKTDANQYSVAMSMGYHFNKNAWNITPNASVRYVRTSIDAFSETGAGGFNFAIADQEVKSMLWSFGASVSKAISLKRGIISPQFDINLSRETENDGGLLQARFINAPDDEIFFIETDEPDRTFGSAGVGLVFIGANGKQAYINYRSIFGLEGFTRGTINLGARFEF